MCRYVSAAVFSVLLASSVVVTSGCSEAPPTIGKIQADVSALATFTVEQQTVATEIAFDGVVEAVNQAVVSAQTVGRVTELPFDVGDYVAKGDVVARFTDSEQQAGLRSANAGLEEAKARLSEAEQQFVRIQDVYKRGLVAKSNFDQAEAQYKSVKARVEAAQAAVTDATERLRYTVVIAPYPGIVVKRMTDIGASVAPGSPLIEGVSLEHLRVKVAIPLQHIGPLRKHKKARVVLDSGESLAVETLRLPPNADPNTHSFNVLLELPRGDYGVFPGTLSKVVFVTGEKEKTLVPSSAVAHRGELTGIYVLNEGRLEFRYVRVGTVLGDGRVPVVSGLDAGETIILDTIAAAVAYKQQFASGKE